MEPKTPTGQSTEQPLIHLQFRVSSEYMILPTLM